MENPVHALITDKENDDLYFAKRIESILQEQIDISLLSWEFRIWDFTDDQSIKISFEILNHYNVLQTLKIPERQMMDFLHNIYRLYFNNPYHSFLHAVDILEFIHMIFKTGENNLDIENLEIAALMIAAICHDAGHPGLNNYYSINSASDIAAFYNNNSILENFSIDTSLVYIQKYRIFSRLSSEDEERLNEIFKFSILATDMVAHFDLMDHLGVFVETIYSDAGTDSDSSDKDVRVIDRDLLLKVLIHMSDISNACRPWEVCKKWSDCVNQEFLIQGDIEKFQKLSISPNMDRDAFDQAQMSINFNDFIVRPFYSLITELFPPLTLLLDFLDANRDKWELLQHSSKNKSQEVRQDFLNPKSLSPHLRRPSFTKANAPRRMSIAAGMVTIPDKFIVPSNTLGRILFSNTPSARSSFSAASPVSKFQIRAHQKSSSSIGSREKLQIKIGSESPVVSATGLQLDPVNYSYTTVDTSDTSMWKTHVDSNENVQVSVAPIPFIDEGSRSSLGLSGSRESFQLPTQREVPTRKPSLKQSKSGHLDTIGRRPSLLSSSVSYNADDTIGAAAQANNEFINSLTEEEESKKSETQESEGRSSPDRKQSTSSSKAEYLKSFSSPAL